jgi:DNA-binding NtrC family response regulator
LLFGELGAVSASEMGAATPEHLADYLAKCERAYITQMLDQHAWRITETAGHLGISRKALWDKMRRLEIARADDQGES